MQSQPLQVAAQGWTANDLIEDAVAWRDRLEEWMKGVADPAQLALAVVELEDLLVHEMECLGLAKRRILELNA